ncbi:hypothetical protein PLICRDRAFT_45153 [Plicaturopsis crispa FD-325 SS-3]|uniref:Methyltransferase domain-containing protein n=1 Tax=Plicaturopsis crispa FD-325 SS-3 TaxID=944288 RepID=A0A0C9SL84_PLICR|nr:hypothetical protein PLICRDRAFT_45153 [Plicaturopsis crispa FD-325 SS-3]
MAMAVPTKDVQAQLMRQRVRKRRPGVVPYPLKYSSELLDFDNWDQMFMFPFSLTIHQFSKPPSTVLDLGCGGGRWCVEAAKQWPETTIVGFDIQDIQPKLHGLEFYKDIAPRIKWVRGNLLDRLPFATGSFDFVRIVGIGLAVPEDEWQFVLEEVSRVLKPGAVVEIIEEDLIFPCSPPPKTRPPPLRLDMSSTPTLVSSSHASSLKSATTPSTSSSYLSTDPWSTLTLHSNHSTRSLLRESTIFEEPEPPEFEITTRSSSSDDIQSRKSDQVIMDGQDHTKLKRAWEAMLGSRFLASQLVSVLPFYLSSAFEDVRSLPLLQVPLPPNSGLAEKHRPNGHRHHSYDKIGEKLWKAFPESYGSNGDDNMKQDAGQKTRARTTSLFDPSTLSRKMSVDTDSTLDPQPPDSLLASAPMHLAKTVQTVISCKDAIRVEYERLYVDDPSIPQVTRSSRSQQTQQPDFEPKINAVREEFERLWTNWLNDMTDRIGARERVRLELLWSEPADSRPVWRVWRDSIMHDGNIDEPASSGDEVELCRSLRGFVGWTPPLSPADSVDIPTPGLAK